MVCSLCCAVLCCAVLCCAVLCCAALCLCCAVLCCVVLCCAVLCCAGLCCAVLCCACAVPVLCCLSDLTPHTHTHTQGGWMDDWAHKGGSQVLAHGRTVCSVATIQCSSRCVSGLHHWRLHSVVHVLTHLDAPSDSRIVFDTQIFARRWRAVRVVKRMLVWISSGRLF